MKKYNLGFDLIVKDAKSRIKEIDIKAVQKLLNDSAVSIIDVREDSEWLAGHLPNATHLCKGIIERDIENVVTDDTKKIVVYCGGGSRSALVADNLQKMGYKNVWSMIGGFRAWQEATLPVVKT